MKAPLIYVGGTLTTARLTLEPLAPTHADAMFAGFADRELYRWIDAQPPADVEDLRQRFARVSNPYAPTGQLWLNWAMRLTDGDYVGVIEATVRPDRIVFLAYYVFSRYARQGMAREACRAAIEHLWRAYDAREIRAAMDYRNVPARCLIEALGFVRRRHTVKTTFRGEPSVDYRYRLTRPESV